MYRKKYPEYVALLSLLITFFGFFATKVWDIDYWSHIASGRYIVESGTIPSQDPFAIYPHVDAWGQLVLKSQWLGQVLLYEIQNHFGLDGIVAWRAAMLTACLWLVYRRCRIAGTNLFFALLMTAITGLVLHSFTGERPQLFSFLYLAVMLLLLDAYQQTNHRWLLFAIPPIFILWANTHGGVLFGLAALGLYGMGSILQTRSISGKFDVAEIRLISGVVVLSAIASFLAPNGINTLITTLRTIIFSENSILRGRTSEYATPWAMRSLLTYYWVFLAMVALSLYGLLGKAQIRNSLFVVVIAAFSLTGSRYVPLFALAVAPYVASSLSRLLQPVLPPNLPTCLATAAISLGFLGYGLKQGMVFQGGMQESKYPVEAVNIINNNHMSGKLFNTLNFGGYLDWNLSTPSVHVFIDGRLLDINRLAPYTNILWMTPAGKDYFERMSFDLVLVSPGNPYTGESYPLIPYLLNNPLWRLVHKGNNSLFFARIGSSP
jgi:hypothetical protein